MYSKIVSILLVAASMASVSGCAAVAAHHRALFNHQTVQSADQINGEWSVTFHVHEMKMPGTFTFKLEGTKLSGTAYSDHTGPGTIRDGKFADGKLSFTVDFQKHESIVVTGALKDGQLSGEFSTEGFTDKWEAVRK